MIHKNKLLRLDFIIFHYHVLKTIAFFALKYQFQPLILLKP